MESLNKVGNKWATRRQSGRHGRDKVGDKWETTRVTKSEAKWETKFETK